MDVIIPLEVDFYFSFIFGYVITCIILKQFKTKLIAQMLPKNY